MRAVANRRPETVRKRFTPNPSEGGAERQVNTVLNRSWPVLNNAATGDLARQMIEARNLDGLVGGLPWADFMDNLGQTAIPFTRTVADAVQAAAMDIGPIGARISFQNVDAVSAKYGYTQSAKLVRSITEVQRDTIRQTVGAAMEGRYTADETARVLQRSIGLFPAWAQAVENRRGLLNRQFIKNGMSPEKASINADRMAGKYSDQLVKRRSMNIARTEIQTASNIGRYATWGQMIGSGAMAATSRKEWAPGAGACPTCSDMAGETVQWDQPFSNGLLMPPAHVCCRCSAVLIPALYQDQSLNPVNINWLSPSYAEPVAPVPVEDLTPDSPFLGGMDNLAGTAVGADTADDMGTEPDTSYQSDQILDAYNSGDPQMSGMLMGGNMAATFRATLADGTDAVIKIAGTSEEADKEYVAGRILNSLGVDNVTTAIAKADTTVSNFVDGQLGVDWVNENMPLGVNVREFKDSIGQMQNGRETGLLDFVINNPDRHNGNWLVDSQGRIAPIDHGNAMFHNFGSLGGAPKGPFAQWSITTGDVGTVLDASRAWTEREFLNASTKIKALATDEKLASIWQANPDWLKFITDRLDHLYEMTNWP